jgi:hypothetical protein
LRLAALEWTLAFEGVHHNYATRKAQSGTF